MAVGTDDIALADLAPQGVPGPPRESIRRNLLLRRVAVVEVQRVGVCAVRAPRAAVGHLEVGQRTTLLVVAPLPVLLAARLAVPSSRTEWQAMPLADAIHRGASDTRSVGWMTRVTGSQEVAWREPAGVTRGRASRTSRPAPGVSTRRRSAPMPAAWTGSMGRGRGAYGSTSGVSPVFMRRMACDRNRMRGSPVPYTPVSSGRAAGGVHRRRTPYTTPPTPPVLSLRCSTD